MNEDILNKYLVYLRQKYRKKSTVVTYHKHIQLLLKWIDKPIDKVTVKGIERWKTHLNAKYKPNGIVTKIASVNVFFKWYGRQELVLKVPRRVATTRTILSKEEVERFLETAKTDPLWNLVALAEYDLFLRPSDIIKIRISRIDRGNHILYTDDSKTGDTSVPMSPRFERAIDTYMRFRSKPQEQNKDYLIIDPHSFKGIGRKYEGIQPIQRIIKKIGIRAGIKKHITPYTIKSTGITIRFDEKVNPKIIQRIARHKDIKTTLEYDHTTDQNVIDYFKQQELSNVRELSSEDKAKTLLEQLFKGSIDFSTFQVGMELLKPEIKTGDKDVAYQ